MTPVSTVTPGEWERLTTVEKAGEVVRENGVVTTVPLTITRYSIHCFRDTATRDAFTGVRPPTGVTLSVLARLKVLWIDTRSVTIIGP